MLSQDDHSLPQGHWQKNLSVNGIIVGTLTISLTKASSLDQTPLANTRAHAPDSPSQPAAVSLLRFSFVRRYHTGSRPSLAAARLPLHAAIVSGEGAQRTAPDSTPPPQLLPVGPT